MRSHRLVSECAFWFLLLLLTWQLAVPAHASDNIWYRGSVYYSGWDSAPPGERSIRNTGQSRRAGTRYQVQLRGDDLIGFLALLNLPSLRHAGHRSTATRPDFRDARLIVDLFTRDGGKSTLYATPGELYSEDGSHRPIDETFRQRVADWPAQTVRSPAPRRSRAPIPQRSPAPIDRSSRPDD